MLQPHQIRWGQMQQRLELGIGRDQLPIQSKARQRQGLVKGAPAKFQLCSSISASGGRRHVKTPTKWSAAGIHFPRRSSSRIKPIRMYWIQTSSLAGQPGKTTPPTAQGQTLQHPEQYIDRPARNVDPYSREIDAVP